jgi:hypothetical protein
MKIGGSEDLFRLKYQLLTSRLSGFFHLTRVSRIRLLKLAALPCLTVLAFMGSIAVAGAPPRPAFPIAHGGHAKSIHLRPASEKSIHLSSASQKPLHRHEHRVPLRTTTAD